MTLSCKDPNYQQNKTQKNLSLLLARVSTDIVETEESRLLAEI